MAWKTVKGERVLGPKEACLFANALNTTLDIARNGGEGLGDDLDDLSNQPGPFVKLTDVHRHTVWEEVVFCTA